MRASEAGGDALRAAVDVARGGARVTVVASVPLEKGRSGCCGLSGVRWNEYLLTEAGNDLEEARHIFGDYDNVEFLAVPGTPVAALIETACRLGADLIITPGRPPRALRRRSPCAILNARRRRSQDAPKLYSRVSDERGSGPKGSLCV